MKAKAVPVTRTEDEVREVILRYFFDLNKKARSLKSSRTKIGKTKQALKAQGLTEQEIARNLAYLLSSGWIEREVETGQVPTARGTFEVRNEYYRISDKGINHFEGPSKFQRSQPFAGINIGNVNGVVAIGDGNIVNFNHSKLYSTLDVLSEEVRKSAALSDGDKLNYAAEIQTIKSQLSKPEPDKSIIATAWESLKPLATVSGIAGFFEKASELVKVFL